MGKNEIYVLIKLEDILKKLDKIDLNKISEIKENNKNSTLNDSTVLESNI